MGVPLRPALFAHIGPLWPRDRRQFSLKPADAVALASPRTTPFIPPLMVDVDNCPPPRGPLLGWLRAACAWIRDQGPGISRKGNAEWDASNPIFYLESSLFLIHFEGSVPLLLPSDAICKGLFHGPNLTKAAVLGPASNISTTGPNSTLNLRRSL